MKIDIFGEMFTTFTDWKKLRSNLEYPWIYTVLRTERKMARRFAKVLGEEIEEAFFIQNNIPLYP